MATTDHIDSESVVSSTQATLRYIFTIVPIVAGADKFLNLLAAWETYLSPFVLKVIPFSGATFMYAIGIIEIVAGVLVWLRPRLGGFVVMAWLIAIALQLILSGHHLDVAVRDLVIAFAGALTLARLTPNAASSAGPGTSV